MLISASPLSNSYIPTSKTPTTREALEPRQRAGRRDRSLRRDHDDRIADAHAERARELGAEHDAEARRASASASEPRRMCWPMSATVSSRAGSMPRIERAAIDVARREHRLAERRTARRRVTCGSARAHLATASPVGSSVGIPRTSMCDATDRMRVRSSSWKPFITDSTTISAATPSAMPGHRRSAR